jgi:hypothetical protein
VPNPAEHLIMATFWLWGVRNLFVVFAGLCALAGQQGAADWSIAWSATLGFALIAEVGNRFGRRAWEKKRRKSAAREALRSASDLRERLRQPEQRRAA